MKAIIHPAHVFLRINPAHCLSVCDMEEAVGRPVGGTEYSWCRAVPGGTGTTVIAILLSRPVPLPLLQSTLHNLHNSHPILRARLTIPADNSQPSVSVPPPHDCHPLIETLDASTTAGVLGSPGVSRFVSALHSLLERELNRNPWAEAEPEAEPGDDSETRPIFYTTAYELPEPGGWVLTLRLHTGFCDRTSAVHVLKDLLGALIGNGEELEGHSGNGEDGVIPGIEDLIPKQGAWKPFWARGWDLVGYSLNGLRSETLRFEQAGLPRSSEVIRLVLAREDTRRFLDACEAIGTKLYAALTAAGLIAVHSSKHLENGQAEAYAVVTLVDCRKHLEPVLQEHNIGFYHSAILNTHSIHGGEGLWEVAMRCHQSVSTAKNNKKHLTDMGELNYLMCKAIENPYLTPSSSLRTAAISVFEEPVIYESSEQQRQLGVEDYIGCASAHGVGPSLAMFETIRDGQLDCACVYPSPLHSRKQMEELVDHMKRIIVEGSHEGEFEC